MKGSKSSNKSSTRFRTTTETAKHSARAPSSVNRISSMSSISFTAPSRFVSVSSPSSVKTTRSLSPTGVKTLSTATASRRAISLSSIKSTDGMNIMMDVPSQEPVFDGRPTTVSNKRIITPTTYKPKYNVSPSHRPSISTTHLKHYSTLSMNRALNVSVPHTLYSTTAMNMAKKPKFIYTKDTTLESILPAGMSFNPITTSSRGIKVNADRLRKGNLIEFGDDKKKVRVESVKAAMMGRRPTSLQMELRDPQTGKTYPARFMPGDSVELIELEAQTLNFLYCEGEVGYVMDPETFEQYEFDSSIFGPARSWIPADTSLQCFFYNGAIFSLNLPDSVVATVQSIPLNPTITMHSGNEYKEVTCDNGQKIKVPVFINEGEQIRVKLEDISFMSRA